MKPQPLLFCLFLLAALAGCSSETDVMRNGYYSAKSAAFNQDGWQEFVTIYIHDNKIITVEYNARNSSGLLMSWDVRYLARMKKVCGVNPNQIIREYANELLVGQDPARIRRITGEHFFYDTFIELASVAIKQAATGDKTVAEVRLNLHRLAP